MSVRRMRTWAFAVATVGAVLLGGSKQASAEILLTVSAGTTTESFAFASNTAASQGVDIDGYHATLETVFTTFPGTGGGKISTTVNINGAVTASNPLTVTVQLVSGVPVGGPYSPPGFDYTAQSLLPWTAPATTPVKVSAGASFATDVSVSNSGPLVTTTTYYNSPPAGTFGGSTPVVSATQNPPNNSGNSFNLVLKPNSGTYTLSQTLVLSGINIGADNFNFGGTSSVTATPEPSTMALAGLGALGLVGYGLRRRKAMGA